MKNLLIVLGCSLFVLCVVPEADAFANVSYNWPRGGGYNLDQELQIDTLPDPSFGGFFWSHQFYVGDSSSANTLYMGFQQWDDGERGAIFSIFYDKDTQVDPGNVVCNVPAKSCAASQGAGDGAPGAQIIVPYDWKVGRNYRLRIWAAPPAGKTDPGWWRFYIKDLTTNVETQIGSIYNQNRPGGTINPGKWSVGWGEIFGGQQHYGNCAYSPQRVIWSRPTMNSGSIAAEIAPYEYEQTPFRVFVSDDEEHYEMLACPMGGFPVGAFGKTACYFLGELGGSCNEVCSSEQTLPQQCSQPLKYDRGGVGSSQATMPYLGTPSQGGDSKNCNDLVTLFGFPNVESGTRNNPNEGVGCHVTPPKSWYLLSPDTQNAAAAPGVRRVCGCVPYSS
jgi:hypothetical protein